MKKQLLFFIFLIIINSTSFSFDIAQKFSNTIVPLSDISVDRLWRAQRDDCSIEDFHYQQEIWKREGRAYHHIRHDGGQVGHPRCGARAKVTTARGGQNQELHP